MPALNARPAELLDEWLAEITETLAAYNKANPDKPAAPLPSTRSCTRATTAWSTTCRCAPSTRCRSSSRPWAREDVNQAVHSWGGVVLHDIINNKFAHKAIERAQTA